jgi:hypothetical protein
MSNVRAVDLEPHQSVAIEEAGSPETRSVTRKWQYLEAHMAALGSMTNPLPRISVTRKTGSEALQLDGDRLPVTLLDFWQWSASDLVSNVTRGRLAEFIVATSLGIDTRGVRNEWDAFDLVTPAGLKVEVKSAAVVQSWHQRRLSPILWRVPRTRAWDATTNVYSAESRRQADIYVFALLWHEDKSSIDPMNLSQWCFFVLPTRLLDARTRSQHSITLSSLRALAESVPYSGLPKAVQRAGELQHSEVDVPSSLGLT